jgi:flagellar protein FlgJ
VTDANNIIGPTPVQPTTGISANTSRLTSRANLKAAGEKFEAVFVNMMLKSMRQTKLAGDEGSLFDTRNADTFRDMQDQKVSESMAAHQPIGIGKAMTDFLSRTQSALQPQSTTPAPDGNAEAGGTTP